MPRKTQPTTLGDIMDDTDGAIIEVKCDALTDCDNVVEWPARAAGLLESLREQGVPIHCEQCSDRIQQETEAAELRKRHEQHIGLMRKRSGIPAKWIDTTFDRIDADEGRADAISAAAEWALGVRRRGLLFHGDVGRGKTAIAAAAANGRISRGEFVRWLPVGELMMDLRMPFESPEYVRAQRSLNARGALVLDDLDKVRPSDHAREPIYVAVNAWVEAELPLIVTMNGSLAELADDFGERYGDAVASRLAGYCDIFSVTGHDRRL